MIVVIYIAILWKRVKDWWNDMINQDELLSIIGQQIKHIDDSISNVSFDSIEEIIKNKNFIEQNFSLSQFSFLNKFNLDELRKILPDSFDRDLANLSFYISILNTSYSSELSKQPKVIEQIKEIMSKIYEYLDEVIKKQTQDRKKVIELEESKMNLEKLRGKISSNEGCFEDKDIETVYDLLSLLDDRSKAIDLLISFGEELLHDGEIVKDTLEEEQIIENDEIGKVWEELIEIFNRFGLDFELFYGNLSEIEQDKFIRYVKPDKVEELLNILEEFGISLNDSYYDCPLILYKTRQIRDVLLYSNGGTLRMVLEHISKKHIYTNIVDENGNIRRSIDFDLLLEVPGRLKAGRKFTFMRKGTGIVDAISGSDSDGTADDFVRNIDFFESLGVKPIDLIRNAKVSILPTEKIKKIISVFDLYGINKEFYIKTLSCFDSIHQADILDQFIELGQFNYILKNMSRCRLLSDSPIFYRLVYGIKYTDLPMESIVHKNGNFTSLVVDTSKKNGLSFEINSFNGKQKVNQTALFYGDNDLYQAYSELINPISSDVTLALTRDDSIVHFLDDNFLVKKDDGEMIYPNVYCFGEIVIPRGKWKINISRNKVLRICNELMQHNVEINDMDTIMFILTKNSILTQDEYNIIYDQVDGIRKRMAEK